MWGGVSEELTSAFKTKRDLKMPEAQRTLVTDWYLFCPLTSPSSPAHSGPGRTKDSLVGDKGRRGEKKKNLFL